MCRSPVALVLLALAPLGACGTREGAAANPGSPAPVADAPTGPATTPPPRADPSSEGTAGLPRAESVPVRPSQARLVRIQDALEDDALLGHRVRVAGRCTGAGSGRRAGSWTLEDDGFAIEVRGLVPSSCNSGSTTDLIIFAQIEPKAAGSSDRLLLRLPD